MKNPLVVVDTQRHQVTANGKLVSFAPKEFAILVAIGNAFGHVLSRPVLLEKVWGYNPDEVRVDSRTVDQHVARTRSKLKKHGLTGVIVTVPSAGYRSTAITIKNPDAAIIGKVEKIDRVYGKAPGSRLTMFVPDLMPTVEKGRSLRLS
jgi:DNA-binding winged helix-turn-helix (wHTH) protein